MACAEGEGDPPRELITAWQCERWHALPAGGGLLDQPAGLMERMSTALNVYESWKSWKTEGQAAGQRATWANEHPEMMRVVKAAREILESNDG